MNKRITVGIISLFILSAVAPMSLGYNIKTPIGIESKVMDNLDFYIYNECESSKGSLRISPLTRNIIDKKYTIPIYSDNISCLYYNYLNYDYGYYNDISIAQTDDVHFYGQSNESIYIVKVSSLNPILLKNASYSEEICTIGKQNTSTDFFSGCFFTNKTWFSILMTSSGKSYYRANLRYKHFKLGRLINYTYDNRLVKTINSSLVTGGHSNYPFNLTLNPGTWYFIFFGVVYDLNQNDVTTHWKVWMNFSNEFNDLEISDYEGGTLYGLWYGEYDANIIISKACIFEFMLNGKVNFKIKNNFIYMFEDYPRRNGFWNIRWITPKGPRDLSVIIIKKKFYYNEEKVEGCVYGIGGPGDYYLKTSYLDYDPYDECACASYFIGMDIIL